MAITRGDTSSAVRTATGTDASITHTVDVGTTLVVISVMHEGNSPVTGTPSWSGGGGENFTLVDETTLSGSNNDMGISTWALASPTAGVGGTITITVTSNDNSISVATSYLGTTVSATMTDNIAFLSEHVDDAAATATVTLASGGTTGNTLYAAGSHKGGDGGDGTQITVPTSFFEIFEGESGTNVNSDISGYACDYIGGAAAACSWIWAATDEHAAHYFEITPAGTQSIVPHVLLQHSMRH